MSSSFDTRTGLRPTQLADISPKQGADFLHCRLRLTGREKVFFQNYMSSFTNGLKAPFVSGSCVVEKMAREAYCLEDYPADGQDVLE